MRPAQPPSQQSITSHCSLRSASAPPKRLIQQKTKTADGGEQEEETAIPIDLYAPIALRGQAIQTIQNTARSFLAWQRCYHRLRSQPGCLRVTVASVEGLPPSPLSWIPLTPFVSVECRNSDASAIAVDSSTAWALDRTVLDDWKDQPLPLHGIQRVGSRLTLTVMNFSAVSKDTPLGGVEIDLSIFCKFPALSTTSTLELSEVPTNSATQQRGSVTLSLQWTPLYRSKCGFLLLYQHGNIGKSAAWARCWVVLRDGELSCFSSRSQGSPFRTCSLASASVKKQSRADLLSLAATCMEMPPRPGGVEAADGAVSEIILQIQPDGSTETPETKDLFFAVQELAIDDALDDEIDDWLRKVRAAIGHTRSVRAAEALKGQTPSKKLPVTLNAEPNPVTSPILMGFTSEKNQQILDLQEEIAHLRAERDGYQQALLKATGNPGTKDWSEASVTGKPKAIHEKPSTGAPRVRKLEIQLEECIRGQEEYKASLRAREAELDHSNKELERYKSLVEHLEKQLEEIDLI